MSAPANWRGVRTVAAQEVRLRVRTGRWQALLLVWVLALAGLTWVEWSAADSVPNLQQRGVPIFGGLMVALLSLSLLVVPTLSAQSINGDRERGVLATLQVTLLTPTEIALGKWLAGWGISLVFLLAAVPMAVATLFAGGVGVGRLIVTMLVLAVLLGVVSAISLCWSAVVSRTRSSAVLSNLSVFALTFGTLIAFGLALPTTRESHTSATRPEKVWWLLAPNPYVILADAAPERRKAVNLDIAPTVDDTGETSASISGTFDPLASIAGAVRGVRSPGSTSATGDPNDAAPVWPLGLGFDVLLAAGALTITVRRLRTPVRRLPRGVRVA